MLCGRLLSTGAEWSSLGIKVCPLENSQETHWYSWLECLSQILADNQHLQVCGAASSGRGMPSLAGRRLPHRGLPKRKQSIATGIPK